MATCEFISVGTELLLGDIVDTNSRFLANQFAALGFNVLHQCTVGDNPERLKAAIEQGLSRSDIIITSGGLGPTPDDITKEVCCEIFDRELILDESILLYIENFFQKRNSVMPQTNKKQVLIPKGCTVLHNSHGTAPGIAMEKDDKHIILLPGPPNELEPMFFEQVVPYLKPFCDSVIISHSIRTMGIGESALAEKMEDMLNCENPSVAPYAKQGEALLRVTAKAKDETAAQKLCEPVVNEICARLGDLVYGVDINSIEQAVVNELKENNLRVAFAESCTGGLIAKRLTDIPGASNVFDCAVVSYSNEIKASLLGVSRETIKNHGAVSRETAEEMAKGILNVSGADIGVGVTGIAGPESDGTDKPAGLIYIGIAYADKVFNEKIQTGRNERDYNRYVTASTALNLIRLEIKKIKGAKKNGE